MQEDRSDDGHTIRVCFLNRVFSCELVTEAIADGTLSVSFGLFEGEGEDRHELARCPVIVDNPNKGRVAEPDSFFHGYRPPEIGLPNAGPDVLFFLVGKGLGLSAFGAEALNVPTLVE